MFTINPDLQGYEIDPETGLLKPQPEEETSGGGINLSSLLDYLLRVRRVPQGVQFSPGIIPETQRKASEYMMTLPSRLGQGAYQGIQDIINRFEVSPEGLVLKTGASVQKPTEGGEAPSESRFTQRQWRPSPEPPKTPAKVSKTPTVPALPEPPAPGETLGTPQYTAPTETPVVSPPTETPVTPTTPEIPDFSKLIKPWKSGVNYEEELMKIFKESMPTSEELPQSKFREPKTIREFFSDFAKYAGIAMAGKDPWAYKQGESKEARMIADKETDYVLKRSAQLANLRIAGLTEKMKREDTDRANKDAYLRNLQAQYPEIAKQPYFQSAVASVAGIPPEEAEAFLKKHVDSKTGLLESFYRSPVEKAIDQEKAVGDFRVKQVMEATGYPIDKAKYVVFTGKDDPGAYLMMKYQRAMQAKDPVALKQAVSEIQQWKALSTFDPERDQAIALLKDLKDPKVEKNAKAMFDDPQSYKNFKQYNLGIALGAKGWKPSTPTDMHFNEEIAIKANNSIGNPTSEKAFLDKYGVHPRQVVAIYMKWVKDNDITDPIEPIKSIRDIFPDYKGKLGDILVDPTMKEVVNRHLAAKYAPIWTEINRTLPAKNQLTPQEMYELATFINRDDAENYRIRRHQLYVNRKIGEPGTPTK